MEYADFKPLFGFLMFGAALVFGFSQLAAVKPERRAVAERAEKDRPRSRGKGRVSPT